MSGAPALQEENHAVGAIDVVLRRVYYWRFTPEPIKLAMLRNAEFVARLRAGASSADAGHGTDTTGMTDDEFLEVLRGD